MRFWLSVHFLEGPKKIQIPTFLDKCHINGPILLQYEFSCDFGKLSWLRMILSKVDT